MAGNLGMRSKNFCFTLNIVEKIISENELIEILNKMNVVYYLFQKEKGKEGGNEHFQGVLSFKNQRYLKACIKLFNNNNIFPHVEICRRMIDAKKYCRKEETRIGGPWGSDLVNEEIENNFDIENVIYFTVWCYNMKTHENKKGKKSDYINLFKALQGLKNNEKIPALWAVDAKDCEHWRLLSLNNDKLVEYMQNYN